MCALALPGAVSYLRTLEYDEAVWPGKNVAFYIYVLS